MDEPPEILEESPDDFEPDGLESEEFEVAVDFAEHVMRCRYDMFEWNPAPYYADVYQLGALLAADKPPGSVKAEMPQNFLRQLLRMSEESTVCWDTLLLIGADMTRDGNLPDELLFQKP